MQAVQRCADPEISSPRLSTDFDHQRYASAATCNLGLAFADSSRQQMMQPEVHVRVVRFIGDTPSNRYSLNGKITASNGPDDIQINHSKF